MLRLTRLRLQQFRNYAELSWELGIGDAGRVVVITGPNGSGKTNLLEAISLLVPGRGLRGSRSAEFGRRHAETIETNWGIAARFSTEQGTLDIGTGISVGDGDRRAFRLDGAAPRSQADITARIAIVWLTPQMDLLFQEPASGRRRFLDRLVYALEPSHARELAAHDAAQTQRGRLLAAAAADPAWLGALEDTIARHAVAATAARISLVARLNQALRDGAAAGFPPAAMTLACPIADRLGTNSALTTEDWLRAALHGSRAADAQAGSARFGAQRSDVALTDAATGRAADLASTGQRKALLVGVVLGHAALIAAQRGQAPLLLLDEPMVHLDTPRRMLLCAAIASLPAQILLTGTDVVSFDPLRGGAAFVETRNGTLDMAA